MKMLKLQVKVSGQTKAFALALDSVQLDRRGSSRCKRVSSADAAEVRAKKMHEPRISYFFGSAKQSGVFPGHLFLSFRGLVSAVPAPGLK